MIELLSVSDRWPQTEAKMNAWIANGAQLAWLLDPYRRIATAYSSGQEPSVVCGPTIQGSGPVEGFTLDLTEVWNCYEV